MEAIQHGERVVQLALCSLVGRDDLGQDYRGQAGLEQQSDRRAPIRLDEHPLHFHGDPLRAHDGDLVGHLADGPKGLFFQRKSERGREAHRGEHPQLVFGEPLRRRADRPEDALAEVLLPADEVDHLLLDRIVEEAVDRKVAARGVLLGRAEG